MHKKIFELSFSPAALTPSFTPIKMALGAHLPATSNRTTALFAWNSLRLESCLQTFPSTHKRH